MFVLVYCSKLMRQKIEWLRLRLVLLLLFVCMATGTRSQALTQRNANNEALKIHQLHSGAAARR